MLFALQLTSDGADSAALWPDDAVLASQDLGEVPDTPRAPRPATSYSPHCRGLRGAHTVQANQPSLAEETDKARPLRLHRYHWALE